MLGFSRDAIATRLAAGTLIPIHRGVYAVGHARLTDKGRWMAAVLAVGPDAALSHRSAVALRGLRPEATGPLDVSVFTRSTRALPGICVHRPRALATEDVEVIDGIPVTSLARTLLDYASVARPQQILLALEAAERARPALDGTALKRTLSRTRGHRGRQPLLRAIAKRTGPAPWRQSELEHAFHALIREHGLPEPHCNVVVAGELVDFFWPAQRLVVEVDGFGTHKTRAKFESDRELDTRLQLHRCRVSRVTDARIKRPKRLAREIEALLALGPPA